MNIDIEYEEPSDYIESLIEQIINSTNQPLDPVQEAALDIADSITSLGQSICNLGSAIRTEIRPRPIVIPIPSSSERTPENFFTQIFEIPSLSARNLPQWLFDPNVGAPAQRTTIDIDRLNEICPEEEGEAIECTMECNRNITLQRKLPCEHIFCSVCIVRWMTENSNTCPICRQEVV